jgi:hypothetical protein
MRITVSDMRALQYCAHGSRLFARRHGLDWSRFVRDGIPVEEVERIDDAMMRRVIEVARQREVLRGKS